MPNKMHVLVASFTLLGTLSWAAPATAEDATVGPAPLQLPAPLLQGPFAVKALDNGTLAAQRGGTETLVLNDMKLKGIVGDNEAYNLTTGNNTINGGAFAGVSGVPMVIQNSGNNVLIQNATIVNVQMK